MHKTGRFVCALYAKAGGPQNADIITEIVVVHSIALKGYTENSDSSAAAQFAV